MAQILTDTEKQDVLRAFEFLPLGFWMEGDGYQVYFDYNRLPIWRSWDVVGEGVPVHPLERIEWKHEVVMHMEEGEPIIGMASFEFLLHAILAHDGFADEIRRRWELSNLGNRPLSVWAKEWKVNS